MYVRYTISSARQILRVPLAMDVYHFSTVSTFQTYTDFKVYGLVVLMHAQLSNGAAVVVQPAFSPDSFVQDIHKYERICKILIKDTKSHPSSSSLPSSLPCSIASHTRNSSLTHHWTQSAAPLPPFQEISFHGSKKYGQQLS